MAYEEISTPSLHLECLLCVNVNIQILTMTSLSSVHIIDIDILIRYNENYVMAICWSKLQGCYKWLKGTFSYLAFPKVKANLNYKFGQNP